MKIKASCSVTATKMYSYLYFFLPFVILLVKLLSALCALSYFTISTFFIFFFSSHFAQCLLCEQVQITSVQTGSSRRSTLPAASSSFTVSPYLHSFSLPSPRLRPTLPWHQRASDFGKPTHLPLPLPPPIIHILHFSLHLISWIWLGFFFYEEAINLFLLRYEWLVRACR